MNKDTSLSSILNKDSIWNKIKYYIYLILGLILLLFILIVVILVTQMIILGKINLKDCALKT
jgi:hypothetical protein